MIYEVTKNTSLYHNDKQRGTKGFYEYTIEVTYSDDETDIDILKPHKIGLLETCQILGAPVRETLEICESKEAYITTTDGTLYFKEEQLAKDFLEEVLEPGRIIK